MNMREIRAKAKSLGIKSVGLKKPELIRSIQRAEGNFDCFGTAVDYCDQWQCCFRSLCLNQNLEVTCMAKTAKKATAKNGYRDQIKEIIKLLMLSPMFDRLNPQEKKTIITELRKRIDELEDEASKLRAL